MSISLLNHVSFIFPPSCFGPLFNIQNVISQSRKSRGGGTGPPPKIWSKLFFPVINAVFLLKKGIHGSWARTKLNFSVFQLLFHGVKCDLSIFDDCPQRANRPKILYTCQHLNKSNKICKKRIV